MEVWNDLYGELARGIAFAADLKFVLPLFYIVFEHGCFTYQLAVDCEVGVPGFGDNKQARFLGLEAQNFAGLGHEIVGKLAVDNC